MALPIQNPMLACTEDPEPVYISPMRTPPLSPPTTTPKGPQDTLACIAMAASDPSMEGFPEIYMLLEPRHGTYACSLL